jgi:hypothetical protein
MNTDAPQPIDLPQELVGENRTDPARDAMNISTETEFLELIEVQNK